MHMDYAEDDFRKFRDYVRHRTGIFFADTKKAELMRIVQRKSTESGFPNVRAYHKALLSEKTDPLLDERLTNAVTIGETYFFRYKEQWRLLEESLLPEIVRRKREQGSLQIRIWSAGCSTGEEPYSLAMTLMDLLGDVRGWKIFLLASDLNLSSLQTARLGIYGKWSFRSTPPEKLRRYFQPMADKLQIIKPVRDFVTFYPLNLVADEYPALLKGIHDMDLVLCRNVLIYFDEERIREISNRFCSVLVEGGYLLLGHSEPTHMISRRLRQVNDRGLTFFQRPVVSHWLHAASAPASKPAAPPPPIPSVPKAEDPLTRARALFATGRGEEALGLLLPLADSNQSDSALLQLTAEIFAGTGRYADARKWADRLLQKDSLNVDAYRLCSMIAEATGKTEEALEFARKGLFLDPESVLTLYQLGCIYRRIGEAKKATKCYQNIMKLIEKLPDDTLIGAGEKVSVAQMKNAVKALVP